MPAIAGDASSFVARPCVPTSSFAVCDAEIVPLDSGFAVVKLGTDKTTGEEFAIKIMALPPIGQQTGDNENTREDIFKEIDILVGMEHENVIYMKEYFEENNKVLLPSDCSLSGSFRPSCSSSTTDFARSDACTATIHDDTAYYPNI